MASTYINLPSATSISSGSATEATQLNVLAAILNTNAELAIIDGHIVAISGNASLYYDEATSVAVGIETTILSYTVLGTSSSLKKISVSGQNIGEVNIYKNGSVMDKQYLYYTGFNLKFGYDNILFATGDVIDIKVINNGQDACNFNASLQVLETP